MTRQIYLYQVAILDRIDFQRKLPYDKDNSKHERLLIQLWKAVFPDEKLENRKTEQWKRLGFQVLPLCLLSEWASQRR